MQSLPAHDYNASTLSEDFLKLEGAIAAKSALAWTPGDTGASPPTASELSVMQSLGITFGEGQYSIGGYRYGLLRDAVNYAKLKAQGIAP